MDRPCAGQVIGDYRLEERLGGGGFGEVWRARVIEGGARLAPGALVAVKIASGREDAERLITEARVQADLDHPRVVEVYDLFRNGDAAAMVMECVEGESLRARLLRKRRLSIENVENLLFQLLDLLKYTHRRGVVHGDLKPSNILLGKDGCVRVIDFGLAAYSPSTLLLSASLRTRSLSRAAGTFAYLAPELRPHPRQVAGGGARLTPAADFYALGVILFEALTGRLPGGLELPSQFRRGVPRRLDRVFAALYVADPRERLASVEAVVALWREERRRREALRRRARIAAVLAAAFALGVFASWQGAGVRVPSDAVVARPAPVRAVRFEPGGALVRTPAPHEAALGLERNERALRWIRRAERLEANGRAAEAVAFYEAALELEEDAVAAAELRRRLERARARAERLEQGRLEVSMAKRLFEEYVSLRSEARGQLPPAFAQRRLLEAGRLAAAAARKGQPGALRLLEEIERRIEREQTLTGSADDGLESTERGGGPSTDPRHAEQRRVRPLLERAERLLLLEQHERAIACLERAQELAGPEQLAPVQRALARARSGLWRRKGEAWLRKRAFERALEAYREALSYHETPELRARYLQLWRLVKKQGVKRRDPDWSAP